MPHNLGRNACWQGQGSRTGSKEEAITVYIICIKSGRKPAAGPHYVASGSSHRCAASGGCVWTWNPAWTNIVRSRGGLWTRFGGTPATHQYGKEASTRIKDPP